VAYFPNGTSGMIFQETNCDGCVLRAREDDGDPCPIYGLHLDWNYEQIANKDDGPMAKVMADTKRAALRKLVTGDGYKTPYKCLGRVPLVDERHPNGEAFELAVKMQEEGR
jgi:hypothetical protein